MGVRSRRSTKRRRKAATVSVGDRGVDLISSLNDDLLLRILDLVPKAENVVRTHALSRRWRGLWTGVAALRFDFDSTRMSCRQDAAERSDAAAERYIAFVDGALALRATAAKEPASVEDLTISFDISRHVTEQVVPLSVEAAQGWIRYALQHVVKSFVLKLRLPWRPYRMDRDDIDIEYPVMTLDEMDNYPKMETMHLRLGVAKLLLTSSTVVFPSLIDLSLEGVLVPAGGGYLLSRLVSSACCPLLQKLCLRRLIFEVSTMGVGVTLSIEADTLLELSLESMYELQFLELMTPSLQVLDIIDSFDLNGFTVSAPKLENLRFWVQQTLHINDVHGHLSRVGTLKIQMFSHGETDSHGEEIGNEDRNDATINILQCCRLTECLEVTFEIPKTKYQTVDIIKGSIPLLPYLTHLTIVIELWERHSTGPGVACLLAQCSNIKYLSLRLCYLITKQNRSELDLYFLCDNNSCHWKCLEFSLAHLQKVEFKKLIGTDCEFQFIQSILTKATGIQKVSISLDRFYWRKRSKHALKLMPPEGGLWTTCKDAMLFEDAVYEWEARE